MLEADYSSSGRDILNPAELYAHAEYEIQQRCLVQIKILEKTKSEQEAGGVDKTADQLKRRLEAEIEEETLVLGQVCAWFMTKWACRLSSKLMHRCAVTC